MQNRLIATLCLALFAASPAQAGLFDDDEARRQLAELRQTTNQKLVDLADRLDKLDTRASQKLVETAGQLEQLNQQIANLRGQIEVISFNLDGLQKRQKDLYVDLDQRLRGLEESKAAAASAGAEKQAKNAQQEAEAASAYEAAYALYSDKKLKAAADAFNSLVTTYPATTATANAYFWLGMSRAQTGDSNGAISSWRKLADAFPDNAKAADALRAIASLQLEKGDKKSARKTLQELVNTHPESEAAKDGAKQLKRL